jgi:signal transduction histidine kinase/HAMP domain-containing protein
MKRWKFDRHSLAVQIILSSVALVLLTAVAAGLPAILLIRGQLQQQAWEQVEHGSRAAQALYEANRKELDNLANLTAQRPTLRELLTEGTQDDLAAYLGTLQQSSGLDLVAICEARDHTIAYTGEPPLAEICTPGIQAGFVPTPTDGGAQAWLFAAHAVGEAPQEPSPVVWVGLHLDDGFAAQIRAQTGLEHTFLAPGPGPSAGQGLPMDQVLASSLPARQQDAILIREEMSSYEIRLDSREYYARRFAVPPGELEVEVALDITELSATLRRAIWSLGVSILGVALFASLLGTYLARRISAPLAHLAQVASNMSRWDGKAQVNQALGSPWAVKAPVREVELVAQALEAGRQDLRRSVQELREEKLWVDHLLESIVEGIITLDRHGRITFFSHGAEQITGLQREEVLGRTCDQVFRATETDQPFSQLIPSPGRRQKIPVELRGERHAILAVTGARLVPPALGSRDPSEARIALVFRDVSEEEAVHRLLGHFLANVAHEFRTPLSALAASVELLLDQAPELSPSELEELLSSLHLAVLGLQTLIDNLLEGASIESGHFRVSPRLCDPSEVIAEAVGTMQPLLDKHNQSLVIELPATMPLVRADPRRTVQVLINLLSNASKYGPDAADIEISTAVEGDWVRISVSDRGPGVPLDQRQDLFRPFVHPKPGNDKAEVGVGLGLSVAKAIIEGQGGRVGVEERPGGGSVFWFTLPKERTG